MNHPTPLNPARAERLDPAHSSLQALDPGDALPIHPEKLVPTMLAKRELDYLHLLGSLINGSGRLIELGCFLGGSTAALLEGIQHSPKTPVLPLLVYDQFLAPPAEAFETDPQLAHFGLSPNQSFRNLYEQLHRDRLDQISIREGRLPESLPIGQAASIYPEQEQIELLFVDIAKSWGVHLSAARCFYPHLHPGAILIHQDFGDFRTPWLVVHMYQLRYAFKPLARIRQTPTMSFRCTANPTERIASLHDSPGTLDNSIREHLWDSIITYWSAVLNENAAGWLSGHRAVHALHSADPSAAITHACTYELWSRTKDALGIHIAPDWTNWLIQLPAHLVKLNASPELIKQATRLAIASQQRNNLSTPDQLANQWTTETTKRANWSRINTRLLAQPRRPIVLFGSGRHTRWLLDAKVLDPSITIQAIIDDNPTAASIAGIPVISAKQWTPPKQPFVLLPSSDAYEQELFGRIQSIAPAHAALMRVYTDPDHANLDHDTAASELPHSTMTPPTAQPTLIPARTSTIDPAPSHRSKLSLNPARPWITDLCASYARPDWTQGHINESDAAFLWDCIEASSPEQIIEIGTASGMSTLACALAMNHFAPANAAPSIHAFDLTERCYFDPRYRVGDALAQVAPHLAGAVQFHHKATACDAARFFAPSSVRLALIDANHVHPAPAQDLLALLPVLTPGAIVVLHDIDLDAIHAQSAPGAALEDGPKRLFDAWDGRKIRSQDRAGSNIGCIIIPDEPLDGIAQLADLLGES